MLRALILFHIYLITEWCQVVTWNNILKNHEHQNCVVQKGEDTEHTEKKTKGPSQYIALTL